MASYNGHLKGWGRRGAWKSGTPYGGHAACLMSRYGSVFVEIMRLSPYQATGKGSKKITSRKAVDRFTVYAATRGYEGMHMGNTVMPLPKTNGVGTHAYTACNTQNGPHPALAWIQVHTFDVPAYEPNAVRTARLAAYRQVCQHQDTCAPQPQPDLLAVFA